jgi:transglutaminase-like putative cysteine protease
MKATTPVRLGARLHTPASGWDVTVRYGAAFACTFLAIAAAQLVIPNPIVWLLGMLTVVGFPVSLLLRRIERQPGNDRLNRPFLNFLVFLLTVALTLYVLSASAPELFGGQLSRFLLQSSAAHIISLLMEVFLVFAACRSLIILSDKDAVLCTVPSFSVLLLLIVVHKGSEVVVYFLLWAIASAILLALDHRSDLRHTTVAYVPSPLPGQEAKLSARGLASVMSFSLLCAVVLSYTISGRDPEQRGAAEGWVTNLASRLTQLALNLPDVSVNSGPERQIDFSSGPALPTRTRLWQMEASWLEDNRTVRPHYWRMFALSQYDGQTWSQNSGTGQTAPRERLSYDRWPLPPEFLANAPSGGVSGYSLPQMRSYRRPGYDVARQTPAGGRPSNFGAPRRLVRQSVASLVSNTGYIPALPGVRALRLRIERPPGTVRVRSDGSVDVGVLRPGQYALTLSEVAPQWEYGTGGQPPELRSQRPNPEAQLTPQERRQYLQLPPKLPQRVRTWAQRASQGDDLTKYNDYRRARRLMTAVQQNAVYTLRPPNTPENRDAADFFLFESRRGYCTYFAGALTVACRAVGIPARVISGFANPEWDSDRRRAVFREANVHAWTEVWVPGWGWAVLDATPPDDRGDNAPNWYENWQDIVGSSYVSVVLWAKAHMNWLVSGMLVLMWAAIGGAMYWRREALHAFVLSHGLTRHEGQVDAATRRTIFVCYHKLSRKLNRRFRPPAPWETPQEWLQAAEEALQLRDPQPLRTLAHLYAQAKYSPRPMVAAEAQAARAAYASLSWERLKLEVQAS